MEENTGINMRVISGELLRSLLPFPACIDLMRSAMISTSEGEGNLPLRTGMAIPESANKFGIMPGYLGGDVGAFGIKLVSLYPENGKAGYPSHMGLFALYEAEHGRPVAIMNGNTLTAIRTASATAAATDALARRDARVLFVAGTGEQAINHIHALLCVRPFEEIRIWGRNFKTASTLAANLATELGIPIRPFSDIREGIAGCDVILTVTAARTPIIFSDYLPDGVHINAVGASDRHAMELHPEIVARTKFFVDYRESAMDQAGELLSAIEQELVSEHAIAGEIGEVYSGRITGRRSDEDITVYKSVGVAAQDIAAATYVYHAAEQQNLGTVARI